AGREMQEAVRVEFEQRIDNIVAIPATGGFDVGRVDEAGQRGEMQALGGGDAELGHGPQPAGESSGAGAIVHRAGGGDPADALDLDIDDTGSAESDDFFERGGGFGGV